MLDSDIAEVSYSILSLGNFNVDFSKTFLSYILYQFTTVCTLTLKLFQPFHWNCENRFFQNVKLQLIQRFKMV